MFYFSLAFTKFLYDKGRVAPAHAMKTYGEEIDV
jgi:hypothetical protein